MSILSVSGLSKEFADRTLFKNASFSVEKGDKIGFIGANGVGKTTLFKIIIGELPSTKGEAVRSAHLKIGYLEQHVCKSESRTAIEETLTVFNHLKKIQFDAIWVNGVAFSIDIPRRKRLSVRNSFYSFLEKRKIHERKNENCNNRMWRVF